LRSYPALEENVDCDVVIIGGGITGAVIGHAITEAGFDTVIVDKREIGWGSTSASTALIQYEIDVPLAELTKKLGASRASRAYTASRDAVEKLATLASRLKTPTGFGKTKSLYLASRGRDRKTLRKELELRNAIGIDVEWLDKDDIAARFPFTRPAALLSPDAAVLDPYAFTHALLLDASRHALRVFDRTTVRKVRARENGVVIHTDRGRTVRAREVVFATGYESEEFLKLKVGKLKSTYAIATEPMSLAGWGEDPCIIWESARPYLYLRATEDGRVIVGGEDENFTNPEKRDRLLNRKSRTLAKKFAKLFPDEKMEIAFEWAGTFAETADGLPYIGRHPNWRSANFALCYGGNGITFSVLAAEIIRDELLGHPNEHSDLFRFDRH
jgi:glycine/D-amino acid oxidase-like deaminating enzyme